MAASRKPKQKKQHPVFPWLGGISVQLFGWGALFLTAWFWPAVALVYLGFGVLFVAVLVEPKLRRHTIWKIVAVFGLMSLAGLFSWGIVFVNAPLQVSAFVTDAEYPAGTTIAGISFRPQFTELQVRILNSSDRTYEDLRLLIRPIDPVAAIAQLTNVPGVSFEDKNGYSSRTMSIKPGETTANVVPLDLLATDAGYRMHCPRLPAGTFITIVLALADVRWSPTPPQKSPRPLDEQVREKDYIQRIKFDDFSTYWFGYKDADVYTPRPNPNWVKIDGEYNVALRTRSISQRLNIAGKLKPKR
jgi:hypothetical protein